MAVSLIIALPVSFHGREFTIRPPDGAASGWLEGTTVVAFSLPLGRIHATEECVVTMTSPVVDAASSGDSGSRAVAVPLTVSDRIDSADTSGLPLDRALTTDGGFYTAHAAPATSTEGGSGGSGGRELQRCRWRDTYCGDNFGLRHAFTVMIRRPWCAKALAFSALSVIARSHSRVSYLRPPRHL